MTFPRFGFTRYQWLVLFAAWLGWGFDVFDALLFNYVARLCLPSLLPDGASGPQEVARWTGIITSVLLIGWAIGGIAFGKIADVLGRSRAMLYTMLTYALATAACAFSQSIEMLLVFRFIASLGIGGEWAAGATLVSETVPEEKRVQAGALLYTAAPGGLFLATFVTDLFTNQLQSVAANGDLAWRVVFLTGLIPAAVALWIRRKVEEPEQWKEKREATHIRSLFHAAHLRSTVSGITMASIALITWWSCNAFIPVIASRLVHELPMPPEGGPLLSLQASFVRTGTSWFNLGGLLGTLLTVPAALYLGRRNMFLVYFLSSAAAIWFVYRVGMTPETRLLAFFLNGLCVFGIFGSFTFYLPELFPVHLRATGAGFCYNIGRFITAAGPFWVGEVAANAGPGVELRSIVSWVGVVPLFGALLVLLGLAREPAAEGLMKAEPACGETLAPVTQNLLKP